MPAPNRWTLVCGPLNVCLPSEFMFLCLTYQDWISALAATTLAVPDSLHPLCPNASCCMGFSEVMACCLSESWISIILHSLLLYCPFLSGLQQQLLLASCRVVSTELLLTLPCPLILCLSHPVQQLLPCAALPKQVCPVLGLIYLWYFFCSLFMAMCHVPVNPSGPKCYMNNLELETYTKISKGLGKKAMENKILLVTLAIADTSD